MIVISAPGWRPEVGSYITFAGSYLTIGSTHGAELDRYDTVIHLRTPIVARGYDGHSRQPTVETTADFLSKARQALAILHHEIPVCCRRTACI